MMIRLKPARTMLGLGAALLLAACGSGSDTGQDGSGMNDGTGTQLSSTGGGTLGGNDGGISGQGLPGSTQEFDTKVGNTIHFDTDSYTLNAEAQGILQQQAAWLKQYPQHMATIEGHADERGTREYNLALGDRRATTVLNYLVALGIDKSRLQEVSYGKEKPVCPDASDACYAQNRRGVTALDN